MIERNTAFKTRIKDVVSGGATFRARIFGTAVSKYVSEDRNFASITMDDGSETIGIRTFREDVSLIEGVEPGDMVDVVGKIDVYEDERYISAESINVIDDPNWELVFDLELILKEKRSKIEQKEPEEREEQETPQTEKTWRVAEKTTEEVTEEVTEKVTEEDVEEDTSSTVVLNLIRESDDGEGIKYVKLLEESKLDDEKLEDILNGLMGDGEIYEPKIGRFKNV